MRELLIAGKRKVSEVWVATDLLEGESASDIVTDIVEIARSVRAPVQEVNRKRLEAKARSEAPQGVIAFAAPLIETELADLIKRRPGRAPFLVAVDGVTDPGNLGAMLRCCDGAGVDGVVLPRHRAVHITPTVAKAAAGAVEHVPMALVGGLPAALARIKDAGIWVIGLDDGADRDLFDIGDLAVEGVCLVLGAEGAGLSRLTRERCDLIVSIPMLGRLSSLNVSAAAALATYEIARQRRNRKSIGTEPGDPRVGRVASTRRRGPHGQHGAAIRHGQPASCRPGQRCLSARFLPEHLGPGSPRCRSGRQPEPALWWSSTMSSSPLPAARGT